MSKLQPGDILICKVPSNVFESMSSKTICLTEIDECVTFLRYSSDMNSSYSGNSKRWIEILTFDNFVGDVNVEYFELAFV